MDIAFRFLLLRWLFMILKLTGLVRVLLFLPVQYAWSNVSKILQSQAHIKPLYGDTSSQSNTSFAADSLRKLWSFGSHIGLTVRFGLWKPRSNLLLNMHMSCRGAPDVLPSRLRSVCVLSERAHWTLFSPHCEVVPPSLLRKLYVDSYSSCSCELLETSWGWAFRRQAETAWGSGRRSQGIVHHTLSPSHWCVQRACTAALRGRAGSGRLLSETIVWWSFSARGPGFSRAWSSCLLSGVSFHPLVNQKFHLVF